MLLQHTQPSGGMHTCIELMLVHVQRTAEGGPPRYVAVVFNDSVVHEIATAAVPVTGFNASNVNIGQPSIDPSAYANAAIAAALLGPLQLGEGPGLEGQSFALGQSCCSSACGIVGSCACVCVLSLMFCSSLSSNAQDMCASLHKHTQHACLAPSAAPSLPWSQLC